MHALSHIAIGIHAAVQNGHALYLDPGSGSFLLQILIATIAGAGIFLATYWRKVRGFFAKLFGKSQSEEKKPETKNE